MIEVVFWSSAAILLFVYLGYPASLLLLRRCPDLPVAVPGTELPSVSVLIAAHNEKGCIRQTLLNKIQLDYPREKLEIIVVSDASEDGTDAVVAELAPQGVALIRQEPRQGKTTALNRAAVAANGEILVFCDANSIYAPDALRELVAPFRDPAVGYVTGRLRYRAPDGAAMGGGAGLYMRYENWIRRAETRTGSVVGVNGGIDAVRRDLYGDMRADHQPDFVLPLRVVRDGFRVVFAPRAVLIEESLSEAGDEFRMRVRVSLRAFHTLWEMRELMTPRFGRFAYQFFVHKVLRYLGFLFMFALLTSNLLLTSNRFYAVALAAQVGCYVGSVLLFLASRVASRSFPVFPFHFLLMNLASGVAFFKFLRGTRQATWNPRRGA